VLPDLTVLIAILLGLSALDEQPVDPVLAVVGTLACVCVAVGMTWTGGERGTRAVREERPEVAFASARWVGLWPLLGWIACLEFFHWGFFVGDALGRETWLLRYLLLFLPSLVMFASGWVQQARIEEAVAASRGAVIPAGGPAYAVRQGLKRNAIALLPMFLIIGLLEGVWILGELGVPGVRSVALWLEAMPMLALALMLAVLALLTLFLPAILRRVLPTEPLPPGAARTRLERHAAAIGLRYKELLLWKTTGRVLNAMVVGVTPRTRLIFMTDALLRHLPEEEVLAVFSHEAGHAKRRHLPLFLVLFVTTAVLFQVAGDLLAPWGVNPMLLTALELAFLWFVLLGSVSRIFEREADLFGARFATASSPSTESVVLPGLGAPLPAGAAWMIRALERIRLLSGRGASHRHGSIEERVRYIAAWATSEDVRADFRVRRRRLHQAILLSVLAAAAALAWRLPGDLRLGRAEVAAQAAAEAYEAGTAARKDGDEPAARAHWERAYEGFTRAASIVGADDSLRGRHLGLYARFNAADSAFHGLDDEVRGRAGFEDMLAYARARGLDGTDTRALRYQAQIDLGRIRAHAGDPAAWASWTEARALQPAGDAETGAYYRARARLLRAVLLARVEVALGLAAVADPLGLFLPLLAGQDALGPGAPRRMLRSLTERRDEGVSWDELRRDARLELERLPASDE